MYCNRTQEDYEFFCNHSNNEEFKEVCLEEWGKLQSLYLLCIDLNSGIRVPFYKFISHSEPDKSKLMEHFTDTDEAAKHIIDEFIVDIKHNYNYSEEKHTHLTINGLTEEGLVNEARIELRKCKANSERLFSQAFDGEDIELMDNFITREESGEVIDSEIINLEWNLHQAKKERRLKGGKGLNLRRIKGGKGFG